MISYSYQIEYNSFKTVESVSISNEKIASFSMNLEPKYYHILIIGGNTAGDVRGELNISKSNKIIESYHIKGLFWMARYDAADVGWFRPEFAGKYDIELFIYEIPESQNNTLIIKEYPISVFVPTFVFLGVGCLMIITSIFFYCFKNIKKEFNKITS
jgi:hypothetical protein